MQLATSEEKSLSLASVGGAASVSTTKELLYSAKCACQRYQEYLKKQRGNRAESKRGWNTKADWGEIEQLKEKKKQVESCAKDKVKNAEEFAETAERTQQFSFMAKSSALHRGRK